MKRAVFVKRWAFVSRRERSRPHGARHRNVDGLTGPIGALAEVAKLGAHAQCEG